MATRDLIVRTSADQGLSSNTTLILTFVPVDKSGLYKDQFPVVWKVIKFAAHSNQAAQVTYSARLGVGVTQISHDIVQFPSSFVEMGLGQNTTYNSEDGFGTFTEPMPKPAPGSGTISAQNKSNTPQGMSVGLVRENRFEPLLVWEAVNKDRYLVAQFTPKLQFYAMSNYQESSVIRGELHTDLLGEWNLAELHSVPALNEFRLWEDPLDGRKLRLDYLG